MCQPLVLIVIAYIIKEIMNSNSHLERFLKKNSKHITQQIKGAASQKIRAEILTEEQLNIAAEHISQGGLVAFPTETVYGLGANALNSEALKRIYEVKKRPLTDPIIVHVLDQQQAQSLVLMSDYQRKLFQVLTNHYWPGPLTVILKANLSVLPMIVTAQTGYVGVRSPKHHYARKLIAASKVPIGAPSANLFSHVSPTEPVHVFNDFYSQNISIVDGGRCEYGVQSTVVKILEGQLHIFREGSLTIGKLQQYLKNTLSANDRPKVIVHKKVENHGTNLQSPGQLLKHYAPYLPCYYITSSQNDDPTFEFKCIDEQVKVDLSDAAVISFNKEVFSKYENKSKYYFQVGQSLKEEEEEQDAEEWEFQDIFCSAQEKSKMRQIYYLLRKCENLDVKVILIGWASLQSGTLWDKIFRSTQGLQLKVK